MTADVMRRSYVHRAGRHESGFARTLRTVVHNQLCGPGFVRCVRYEMEQRKERGGAMELEPGI
jgi:hypothetical protein